MSAARLYIIECDGMDCDCLSFASTTDDLDEARRQAEQAGWTYDPSDGTDWGRGHIRWTATKKVLA